MVELTLEQTLLIVELLLLVLTVYLLLISRREAKGRTKLMEQLMWATRTFTRSEYFNIVHESIGQATSYICAAVTGTPPKDDEVGTIERLLRQFERASRSGVKLRFLLPKNPDRLMMGYKYKSVGGEVKYNPSLLVSDLRYMVVDGYLTVLGLPERSGIEEPTRKGQKIYSEGVSKMFLDRFEDMWNSKQSVYYDEFVKQVVSESSSISDELLASLLKIPVEEVKRARSE